LRFVPLPSETPLPFQLSAEARVWKTLTPYVPSRHVFGRNGKPKAGHSVETQLADDLGALGFPSAEITAADGNSAWVKVHVPKKSAQTNAMKRGFHATLTFSQPIKGPLALGNSSHFGLGLFVPVVE
jgi:CRISPR-associated protein Csb2